MKQWLHCKLEGKRVQFLGASRVFENKKDAYPNQRAAFSHLEDEGWELVAVVPSPEEEIDFVYFFKRLVVL